jgi:hypothetical protein
MIWICMSSAKQLNSIQTLVGKRLSTRVCVCVCIPVAYIYIYIYMYIYVYIHIYRYICLHVITCNLVYAYVLTEFHTHHMYTRGQTD